MPAIPRLQINDRTKSGNSIQTKKTKQVQPSSLLRFILYILITLSLKPFREQHKGILLQPC